jgi:hypothetical protein
MVTAATVLGLCLCCRHLVVIVAHHRPLPCNCHLCAIPFALAALPIVLILACHPCHHCHCLLCCLCGCLLATLVTTAIVLLPSPSLSLAHCCHHCSYCCPPQSSLPLLPLLLLDHHLRCHCHRSCHCPHCHCHCLAPLSPLQLPSLLPLPSLTRHPCSCRAATQGGRGGLYQSGAQSNFGHRNWCRHHCCRLYHPGNQPGGARQTTCGHSTSGRWHAPTWGGCCRHLCRRRHPPR